MGPYELDDGYVGVQLGLWLDQGKNFYWDITSLYIYRLYIPLPTRILSPQDPPMDSWWLDIAGPTGKPLRLALWQCPLGCWKQPTRHQIPRGWWDEKSYKQLLEKLPHHLGEIPSWRRQYAHVPLSSVPPTPERHVSVLGFRKMRFVKGCSPRPVGQNYDEMGGEFLEHQATNARYCVGKKRPSISTSHCI